MDTTLIQSLLHKTSRMGLLSAVLILSACGGGGGGGGGYSGLTYSGNTSPAAINATNAEQIGTTASEAVSQSVDSDSLNEVPFGVAVSAQAPLTVRQQVNDIIKRIINDLPVSTDLPIGVTYTSNDLNNLISDQLGKTVTWFCGGSMSGPSLTSTSNSGTFTFYNLCFDINGDGTYVAVMNGTMSFQETTNGNLETTTTSYSDFSVTLNGETYTFSGTQSCTFNTDTWEETCADIYTGADGEVYQIADATVTGDSTNGYYVNATFYHPEFGSIEITTTNPVTICTIGHPGSGTISFTGSGGSSGSVTFTDCDNYTVAYDDGAGNASSFSGTWP